jgi:hypothetical protein
MTTAMAVGHVLGMLVKFEILQHGALSARRRLSYRSTGQSCNGHFRATAAMGGCAFISCCEVQSFVTPTVSHFLPNVQSAMKLDMDAAILAT